MHSFQALISPERARYDGTQLAGHWIYRRHGLLGNAIVAFVGEADVSIDHMVDLEDVKKIAPIYSPEMLHFIGEWFYGTFEEALLMQLLFMARCESILTSSMVTGLVRRGNDLYMGEKKLSVSITTRTTTSFLLHVGLNVRTEGTPVPTVGLTELGIEPLRFAEQIIEGFLADLSSAQKNRVKVIPR